MQAREHPERLHYERTRSGPAHASRPDIGREGAHRFNFRPNFVPIVSHILRLGRGGRTLSNSCRATQEMIFSVQALALGDDTELQLFRGRVLSAGAEKNKDKMLGQADGWTLGA